MRLLYFLLAIVFIYGCNQKQSLVIESFDPYTNYSPDGDTLFLKMNLKNAFLNGITVPSADSNQKPQYFKFSFKIKNTSDHPQYFFYKVFYQNESYKFTEHIIMKGKIKYNSKASGNFYGSWAKCEEGFHRTKMIPADNAFHLITDSFRIVGNPREERKYFGAEMPHSYISQEDIDSAILRIKESDEWMREVKKKAEQNKISMDEQLHLDAAWVAEHESKKGDFNNRWKRNPRVGNYGFLLVAADNKGLRKIPDCIKNLHHVDKKTEAFLNPFYYFLYDSDRKGKGVHYLKSDKVLNTKAAIDFSEGIYIDNKGLSGSDNHDTSVYDCCSNNEEMFRYAQIGQYIYPVSKNNRLHNIPLVRDVVNEGYTMDEYHLNKEKYSERELRNDYVRNTEKPCTTVTYDSVKNAVKMINPGNDAINPVKENIGMKTRTGFTYGKFRAKIKFPGILNGDNVWNGLTCAFWLLYQEDAEWNYRGVCGEDGYIPKGETGQTDVRTNKTSYTEIDFEVVKTSKYWPETSYKNSANPPVDNAAASNNLILACTNWDLACREPLRYIVGAEKIDYLDNVFELHRWDDWYQALTSKYENPHDETVGDIIYYEIDWQPESIIWRIGKSKDHMKVVGYMDHTVTKIPDNQMIAIISQEFQYAEWWPTAPFLQDYIPYPKNDLVGTVYEIEIE
jgi:hypothetical protein